MAKTAKSKKIEVQETATKELFQAIGRKSIDEVNAALNKGADIEGEITGMRMIFWAIHSNVPKIIEIFVQNASLESKDPSGRSLKEYAIHHKKDLSLEVLTKYLDNLEDAQSKTEKARKAGKTTIETLFSA